MNISKRSVTLAGGLLFCVAAAVPRSSLADNPIVQTNYTADPAPMVYDGRLYVYTTHDEDVTVNNFFTMNDWRVYSTTDMVNWTDHGSPLSYKTFSWAKGDAWAGQCIPRDGKFYFYVPVTQKNGGGAIGVAVATSPTGPFTDPLNKPLATTGTGDIDPTVFIDDDGQAYLYWGNPKLWYVKLNKDMTTYPGKPTQVDLTTAGFGQRSKTDRATAYEEGPWFYKRGSLYYIVYPGDGVPENISYTTSSGPTGPWNFRGVIMDKNLPKAAFTNHPGVVDYKGNSYFFYHNAALPGGGGYKRSVCIEQFTYKADGTFPKITMTTAGPAAVDTLNPFVRTEAETIAWSSGLKTEVCSAGGLDVTQIHNGDFLVVKSVEFGAGATSFDARVAAAQGGGNIELRLDSASGPLIGTLAVPTTGGAQTWATKSCTVSGATGKHDLYFKFTGGSGTLFNFDWWQFSGPGSPDGGAKDGGTANPDGGAGGASGAGGSGQGGASGAGAGGSAAGGAAGSAGQAGTGGAGGGSGGEGAAGSGGSSPTAGQGGSAGRGGQGGRGPSAGNGGSSATGGSAGSRAGQAGQGGGEADGGSGGGTASSGDAGGCSCQTGPGRGQGWLVGLAVMALSLGVRRRARSRR